jgi:hypothetical protein
MTTTPTFADPGQEAERLARGHGLQMSFSKELEAAITTPASSEIPGRPPVWLIWIVDEDSAWTGVPSLHCVATSEDSCRYHVGALLEQRGMEGPHGQPRSERYLADHKTRFHVERVPTDHGFGSVMLRKAQELQLITPPITVGQARRFEFGGE